MLTLNQIRNVCLYGQDHMQCRYLALAAAGEFHCIKNTWVKPRIDKQVREFIEFTKQTGGSILGSNIAMGDNCKGYILFKNKKQGYDI